MMKFFSGLATYLVILGCGIMSLIFGLPERYIERDVKADEMVGIWNVTPNSESDVNDFVKISPESGSHAPWKTIIINSDGSCNVKLEIDWLRDVNALPTEFPHHPYPNDVITNNMISCSWQLTKDSNESGRKVPLIKLDFEYPNNYSMRYSLYIVEENGELILWHFIGDVDDFHPQDFIKTK